MKCERFTFLVQSSKQDYNNQDEDTSFVKMVHIRLEQNKILSVVWIFYDFFFLLL